MTDWLGAQREAYEGVVESIREQGGTAKYPVHIADIGALAVDGEDAIMPIACRLEPPSCKSEGIY